MQIPLIHFSKTLPFSTLPEALFRSAGQVQAIWDICRSGEKPASQKRDLANLFGQNSCYANIFNRRTLDRNGLKDCEQCSDANQLLGLVQSSRPF